MITAGSTSILPGASLASMGELESPAFRTFMDGINAFAERNGLRRMTDWSKVWEYPWLWFHGLQNVDWKRATLCDLGSELSPMPWYFASLGAKVRIIETDASCERTWRTLRDRTGLEVSWNIVSGERLPLPDKSMTIVTSFSVIEHQGDKLLAIDEVARVLVPGGIFALSFDICQPELGMTFPEWNGQPLTVGEFEEIIWNNPVFDTGRHPIRWNFHDSTDFITWHMKSAPYHNYTVGAAIVPRSAV